jgi:metal-dependent amidase/aminoacylase/carboxypeptidase family protein
MPPSTDPALLRRLLEGIERELPRSVALRHRLHAQPELAHMEHETAASVTAELPVCAQRIAGTGLLARIGADVSDSTIAVRAELDR